MKEMASDKTHGVRTPINVLGMTVLALIMIISIAGAVVTNAYSLHNGTVFVIDTATYNVTGEVEVGMQPVGIAITPDGSKVYVVNEWWVDTVSVISTATNTVTGKLNGVVHPTGIAVSPDGSKVYVTHISGAALIDGDTNESIVPDYGVMDNNGLSVIETDTNRVITTVKVGNQPTGVTVTPDGKNVYVAYTGSDNVSVIDTFNNTVIATMPVGNSPRGIAVSPDGTKVYVTNEGGYPDYKGTVSVIDTVTNIVSATISVGNGSEGVAVTPDGSKVYVTNYNSNTTSVIDTITNTVISTVPVGNYPKGVAVDPTGKKVYVANQGSLDKENDGTVSVIDTATDTVITVVNIEGSPSGVTVAPDGRKIYLASRSMNQEHETLPDQAGYGMIVFVIGMSAATLLIVIGKFFISREK